MRHYESNYANNMYEGYDPECVEADRAADLAHLASLKGDLAILEAHGKPTAGMRAIIAEVEARLGITSTTP